MCLRKLSEWKIIQAFKLWILYKYILNNFSEKVIVQENVTEMSEKFEESNEKKREKRQRDDNIDREKDSYVSYYIFSF